MHDKWYLKDWNLTLLNQCLNDIDAKVTAYYTTRGMITHYIMWTGYKNGNKSYIMFDNGGELNIFGIGFEFENQKHSMPLPVNGTPKMTGVLAVSHRLVPSRDARRPPSGHTRRSTRPILRSPNSP